MLLWVGLGNPDPPARFQRHNIGFMALDAIAASCGFAPWKSRFRGLAAEGEIAGMRVLGLKPQTYMNSSGESVQSAAAYFKLQPAAITAFHDELDLAAFRLRLKLGGGAAGHNGLRSIDRALASPDYHRVRLGIGHPGHKDLVLAHVLGNFDRAEQPALAALLDAVANAAPLLAQAQPEAFMTRVALLTQDPI